MTCGGCSGAVERVLKKTDGMARLLCCERRRPLTDSVVCSGTGISSYEVSLEKQEVLVKGTIGYDELLEKIKKTGKEVGVPMCKTTRRADS